MEKRYLLKDSQGIICETPPEMFRRVSKSIAQVDRQYDRDGSLEKIEKEFYDVMSQMEFLTKQVLYLNKSSEEGEKPEYLIAKWEYSGGCPYSSCIH